MNQPDKRAELLADLISMPPADTNNLWRRHREATAELKENRFVSLLCKIQRETRKDVLVALNRMNDDEFQQALNLLENDVVAEGWEIINREAAKVARALESWSKQQTWIKRGR